MVLNTFRLILAFLFLQLSFGKCEAQKLQWRNYTEISPGINQTAAYFRNIRDKRIAVVANQSSIFNNEVHLVDSLLNSGINIVKVFCPEHGFRGNADAGAHVKDGIDPKTELPIISLYGKNKKPSKEQLEGIDMIIFDLQDVGVRFYTYISTLKYVLEASAEVGIKVILLDRPNPNGFYIDGPTLKEAHKSFVGLLPIPVVYGMTIGELAQMIQGEEWMEHSDLLDLYIVSCNDYHHNDIFELAVKPSPNLPDYKSIYLYPSLCFFEGTPISVGRGTNAPFTLFGYPDFKGIRSDNKFEKKISFTPKPIKGASLHPKLEGEKCYGLDLSLVAENYNQHQSQIDLRYLISAYNKFKDKEDFFIPFFNLLAGTDSLQEQIKAGKSIEQIRQSWNKDLIDFKQKRNDYLLYE